MRHRLVTAWRAVPLLVLCAWCQREGRRFPVLRWGRPLRVGGRWHASHGICRRHKARLLTEAHLHTTRCPRRNGR